MNYNTANQKPPEISPALSSSPEENQEIADQFSRLMLNLPFDRQLFGGKIRISRTDGSGPRWSSTANGEWEGYIADYQLSDKSSGAVIACELYIGTIGDRGNPAAFADGKSRFAVVRIGKGSSRPTTQYGFHKYLRTGSRSLFSFYELKFSARGFPKVYWERLYRMLEQSGYGIEDTGGKNPSKLLQLNGLSLGREDVEERLADLLEALFAVTVIKAYFKGGVYKETFAFLDDRQSK